MKPKYFFFFLISIGLLLSAYGCKKQPATQDPLERNLRAAGKNRAELEKVLAHYRQNPADSLHLKAAIFLLSNMDNGDYYEGDWLHQFNAIFDKTASKSEPDIIKLKDSIINVIGYPEQAAIQLVNDFEHLKADYLITNIDLAMAAWQNALWKSDVPFDLFCNYILPYRNYREFPSSWREAFYNRFRSILTDSIATQNMDDACCELNEDLSKWFRYSDAFDDYPGRISAANLLKGQRGNCSDMAALGAYTMRALGIPVAIDYTPLWANYPDGHAWNALLLPNGSSVPFLGAESNPGSYTFIHEGESKVAKVFRKTCAQQAASFATIAAQAGETDIPIYLQDKNTIDVTAEYTNVADLTLKLNAPKEKMVYLCIAKQQSWEAIAGSPIDAAGTATFRDMGRNILYLPMFYHRGVYKAAGNPFVLTFEGDVQTLPTEVVNQQTVVLKRKFPLKRDGMKLGYAEYLHRAKLEGANTPDFKDAVLLHTLEEPMKRWEVMVCGGTRERDRLQYESLWEEVMLKSKKTYRYLRLILPEKQLLKVGDLAFYESASTMPLSGTPIGSVARPEWAFDGEDGYSLIDESPEGAQWVGLDFGKPTAIAKLRFLPACGPNQVTPGKTYELFYWSGKWKSLGVQTAIQHSLSYSQVPAGVLFRLHCRDCAENFDRPFTYENGKQVWW